MHGRRRINPAPGLEPLEGRQLLSGLMVALQSSVPILTSAQVASIASTEAQTGTGTLSSQVVAGMNQSGVYVGNGASGNNGVPIGPNAGVNVPVSPLIGTGTPTAAELAREKFTAHFSGPLTTQAPRFSDQSKILFLRGLGTSNFFLHGDYDMALVYPKGFSAARPRRHDRWRRAGHGVRLPRRQEQQLRGRARPRPPGRPHLVRRQGPPHPR